MDVNATSTLREAAEQLETLIDQRWSVLDALMQATTRQETAIEAGHMSELMAVLTQKQRLVEQFATLSQTLRVTREACEGSPPISDDHRARHEQCHQAHQELLAREKACEDRLTSSRDAIAQELAQTNNTRRAASGYGNVQTPATGGQSLDLSSD